MEVVAAGHEYNMAMLDVPIENTGTYKSTQRISFVNRNHGKNCGVTCQEVLRVLIDRVKFLDEELPWDRNQEILYHLRKALLLFEIRALERKLEKGELQPESVLISTEDGHFKLKDIHYDV